MPFNVNTTSPRHLYIAERLQLVSCLCSDLLFPKLSSDRPRSRIDAAGPISYR